MFGFIRRAEFDAFKDGAIREFARLRKEIEYLNAGRSADSWASLQPEVPASMGSETAGTSFDLPGADRTFPVPIVGESYRQATLKALAGDRRRAGEEVFFTAALIPEPSNPHDPNAVKVHIHGGGHVGYLGKDIAADYKAITEILVAAKAIGLCQAKLIGGTPGKPSLGVQLDLTEPHVVIQALTNRAGGAQPF